MIMESNTMQILWLHKTGPLEDVPGRVSKPIAQLFRHGLLSQRTGKRGRRRRGIKYKSSLGTYWKLYHLVYERATGDKIMGQMNPWHAQGTR